VVVMVAREVEAGQEKCSVYWNTDKHRNLTVELTETERERNNVVLRRLRVTNGTETRDVIQLQYVAWPDFGVPETTSDILTLLAQMEAAQGAAEAQPPIVVHCSAGVGRTGTLITVHVCLTQLQRAIARGEASPLDIEAVVRRLRACRTLMVQKKDQFLFCHQAVLEGVGAMLRSNGETYVASPAKDPHPLV